MTTRFGLLEKITIVLLTLFLILFFIGLIKKTKGPPTKGDMIMLQIFLLLIPVILFVIGKQIYLSF
jgi:hypothetical protein